MRAKPTKCFSSRKESKRGVCDCTFDNIQASVTASCNKRTSSPGGCKSVPSGSRAGVAVVNSLLLDL